MQHATGLSQSHIVEWRLFFCFFLGGGWNIFSGCIYFSWCCFHISQKVLKYLDIYPLLLLGTTIYVLFIFINGLLLNFFLKNDLYVKFLWSFKLPVMTFRLLSCNIASKLDFTFHGVQYNYNKYSLLLYTTNQYPISALIKYLPNFWYHIEREFHWLSYIFCSLMI